MTNNTISLADAKKRLSELVGRVIFAGERFVITRRGRPAAVLSPARGPKERKDLADVRGWLPDDDPLFRHLQRCRRESRKRGPRAGRNQ